ncbi:MAG: hypothetical protein F9B45_09805 [Phycisphaera sp. RhM]|nr:hypothetical protein [Phycisphaera sp. RhM]
MLGLKERLQKQEADQRSEIESRQREWSAACDVARVEAIKAAAGERCNEQLIAAVAGTSTDVDRVERYARESIALAGYVELAAELEADITLAIAERREVAAKSREDSPLASAADHARMAVDAARWADWELVVAYRTAQRAYEDAQDRRRHLDSRIDRLKSQLRQAKADAAPSWAPDPNSTLPPHQAFPMPAMTSDA